MTLEVSNVNPIVYKQNKTPLKNNMAVTDVAQINDLKNVTVDFNVKKPSNYTLLSTDTLKNGLVIHTYKLSNGHKVTIVPMENSPTTVKNYVNVGSMNETDNIKGISHFLEHMAFNGTNGSENYLKLNQGDSFNKIDELGGWTNASTNYALTDYVNSTPMLDDKDLEQQIKVISAMTEDLSLLANMVEKEKYPVCSEIDMILDDANTIAIDQTVRTLFNIKSSADELVGGSIEHIQNLTRKDVADYYNKYYTPDNMHLVITGNIDPQSTIELVAKHFHSNKTTNGKKYEEKLNAITKTKRKDFIFPKIKSTHAAMGFTGPATSNIKDFAISDIVMHYITSTGSGISSELKNIDANLTIGHEKISTNPYAPTLLFFQTISSDENSETALKILHDKLESLKIKDEKTLNSIKKTLINNYYDLMENSLYINSMLGQSEFDKNINLIINYEEIINSITLDDVNNYINKYLNTEKAAISVIHPEVSKDDIVDNYNNAKTLSFKGSSRLPIEENKVSECNLKNNYKIVFSESKNKNTPFIVTLKYNIPDDINPAALSVLNKIYNAGTANLSLEEFENYLEENQISIFTNLNTSSLSFLCKTSADDLNKAVDKISEVISEPRITEEEFNIAIKSIKDKLSRSSISAKNLYYNYIGINNPKIISRQKIVDNIDSLTIEDVRKLHNHIKNNSNGYITINIPENNDNLKNKIQETFENLSTTKSEPIEEIEYYSQNTHPIVLSKTSKKSQADIQQTYRFRFDNSLKKEISATIMNLILSSSDSIGLFNELREKEHLAYSVRSSLSINKNIGEVALKILTSTESSETGKVSYDNVQKSIDGFHRQINKLINSEYTDKDLETAKRIAKSHLLNNETVISRISTLNGTVSNGYNLNKENELFKLIDSISRKDIDEISKEIFINNPPVYSITASKNTLDYNKEYLNSLTK